MAELRHHVQMVQKAISAIDAFVETGVDEVASPLAEASTLNVDMSAPEAETGPLFAQLSASQPALDGFQTKTEACELTAEIGTLREQNESLREQNDTLREQIESLRTANDLQKGSIRLKAVEQETAIKQLSTELKTAMSQKKEVADAKHQLGMQYENLFVTTLAAKFGHIGDMLPKHDYTSAAVTRAHRDLDNLRELTKAHKQSWCKTNPCRTCQKFL